MIVEALINLLVAAVKGLASLFGKFTMPSWWSNASGWMTDLASTASGMASWVPWTVALSVVSFVIASFGIAWTIRLVRVLLSLFTGGGGSAA